MRVVQLTTVHHPLDPRIYWKEARSLARAGFDVWLLARGEDITELDDVNFIPLPGGLDKASRLRRQGVAAREIRRLEPDVIHIHDPELIPLARRLKRSTGAHILYDKHEDYGSRTGVEGKALRELEEWAFRWVDHVILAEESYAAIVAGRGVAYTTVLNYALPFDIGRSEKATDQTVLVYTGTVSRSRGLFHMIDLAQRARERALAMRIHVVGICHYADQIEAAQEKVEKNDLEGHISLEGLSIFVPWERIAAAQALADVGLMLADAEPNYVGSVPSKFYEYIHAGLPIIASRIPLWDEFLNETGCGFTVAPERPDEILRAIVEVQRSGLVERMIEATSRNRDRYTWAQMEPRLLAAYGSIEIRPP